MINNETRNAILRKFEDRNRKKTTQLDYTTIDFSSKIEDSSLVDDLELSINNMKTENSKGPVIYKGLNILDINEPSINIGDKITLVIYRKITNKESPFLLFCLLKTNDVLDFPNIKYNGGKVSDFAINTVKKIFIEWPDLSVEFKGYINNNSKTYVFIESNMSNEYKVNKEEYSFNWWFALVSEIINYKKLLQFPISNSVTQLFLDNSELCYLSNSLGFNIEVPNVAYYGGYYKRITYAAALGQRKEGPMTAFGPYYYFNSYERAMRYAIWTTDFNSMEIDGKLITDKDSGKFTKGGIVRFAIFSGKHTMLLNRESDPDDDSEITKELLKQYPTWYKDSLKTRDSDAKWVKNYDSIGLGNRTYFSEKAQKEKIFYNQQIIKNYEQQFPLAFYYIDTNQDTDNLTNIKIE
mgnify:CR=1 FL=1